MSRGKNYWMYRNKYASDTAFQAIERQFITLSQDDKKLSNQHLKAIIEDTVLPLMLKSDRLFNLMFEKIVYGGSFYKGTKYGKPDEYDLDFVMNLPIDYKQLTIDTNHDEYGFVKLKLNRMQKTQNWVKYSHILDTWIIVSSGNYYLNQHAFRKWMEKVLFKVFKNLEETENGYIIRSQGLFGISFGKKYTWIEKFFFNVFQISKWRTKNAYGFLRFLKEKIIGKTYTIRYKQSGPAFTITIKVDKNEIDVDIVPCLEFKVNSLNGYKPLRGRDNRIMVVPKPRKPYIEERNTQWRLCFYHQEKEMLKGQLKPIIKITKKFRDTMKWYGIASYFIETIFYHLYDENRDKLLENSKTSLFMLGLYTLRDALEKECLPYYWHPKYNLFNRMTKEELAHYANQLSREINHIEKKPSVLAKFILNENEFQSFKKINKSKSDYILIGIGIAFKILKKIYKFKWEANDLWIGLCIVLLIMIIYQEIIDAFSTFPM